MSFIYIKNKWSPAVLLLASVNIHTYTHSHTLIRYTHHSTVSPMNQKSSGAVLSVNVCVVDRVNRIIHTNSAGGNNILDFRENAVNIEPFPGATVMTLIAIPFALGWSLIPNCTMGNAGLGYLLLLYVTLFGAVRYPWVSAAYTWCCIYSIKLLHVVKYMFSSSVFVTQYSPIFIIFLSARYVFCIAHLPPAWQD